MIAGKIRQVGDDLVALIPATRLYWTDTRVVPTIVGSLTLNADVLVEFWVPMPLF